MQNSEHNSKSETALSKFREAGFSCAQAVLFALGPELGLDEKIALKVSGAFGGGMAHMAETCGAVTGAFMVIGLKYGMTESGNQDDKDKTYETVHEFVRRFKERNGSIICRDLLGVDLSKPGGDDQASAQNLYEEKCTNYVRDAVEILNDIL
jgi:C_GCAxxG_C_C family probable redox protein